MYSLVSSKTIICNNNYHNYQPNITFLNYATKKSKKKTHTDPQRDSNLWSCEANPRSFPHRQDHVVDDLLDLIRPDFIGRDFSGGFVENRVAGCDYIGQCSFLFILSETQKPPCSGEKWRSRTVRSPGRERARIRVGNGRPRSRRKRVVESGFGVLVRDEKGEERESVGGF